MSKRSFWAHLEFRARKCAQKLIAIPDYDPKTYLRYPLKWLKIFGMWNNFKNKSLANAYNVFTAFIFTLQFIQLISGTVYFLTAGNVTNEIAGTTIALFTFGMIFKQVVILRRKKTVESLLEQLTDMVSKTSNEFRTIENKCELFSQLLTIVSLYVGFSCAGSMLFPSVIDYVRDGKTKLTHRVVYPFDQELYFKFGLFLQESYGLLSTGVAVAISALQISAMMHITGQLSVLNHKLKSLNGRVLENYEEDALKDEFSQETLMLRNKGAGEIWSNRKDVAGRMKLKEDDKNEDFLEKMFLELPDHYKPQKEKFNYLSETFFLDCIEHHCAIYKFVKDFMDVFGPIFYIQMLTNSASICLILYELSKILHDLTLDVTALSSYFMYLLMSLSDIGMTCFFGSELTAQSVDIAEAAYGTNWPSRSTRFKLMVATMIQRAQTPIHLHGYHMYDICNETFFTICKASISYCMVVMEVMHDTGKMI